MTNTNNNQVRNMNDRRNNGMRGKGRIVALALAGVLAIGGVGALCITGLSKSPGQAPVAAQTVATKKATTVKTTAKKAETKKTTSTKQATPKQVETPKAEAPAASSNNSGLEAKVSREQCIKTALAHVGAGGQAKGEAQNVTAKQVTGGGTVYYVVELDLGDVHYTVNVDAIDGGVIGADSTHAGTRTLLDKQGVEIEGTETPAE